MDCSGVFAASAGATDDKHYPDALWEMQEPVSVALDEH